MMSLPTHQARSIRGFTLVELIVVLGLMAIIGAIIATSVSRGLQADTQARSRIEALEDMQVAMERMSREIRAANPVEEAADNAIKVWVHREDSCHLFTYELVGQDLIARQDRFESDCVTSTGTSGELILLQGLANDDVDTAVFTYWSTRPGHEDPGDEDAEPLDTPLTDVGDVSFVEISLVHELALNQRPITVSTVVGLRNH